MLRSATQPSSKMPICSIVDHNIPPGFVTQPMGTLNDLSQHVVPAEPQGFAPDLVCGPTSDDSPFYSSDSCHPSIPEFSRAYIPDQSYLPRHDSQHSPSRTPYMGPGYKPPLHATSTLPAWCATETSPNEGSGTNPSSASSKVGPETAWNTPVTSFKLTTSTSTEAQRRHAPSRSLGHAHHMRHSPHNQQSPSTPSLQSRSTDCDPPRKRRRESSSMNAAHSFSSGNLNELPLHFDAPLIQEVNDIVGKRAETNEKAEAAAAAEDAQRSDPAQTVSHLLRKWTTLLDMPSTPSWDSGRHSVVS